MKNIFLVFKDAREQAQWTRWLCVAVGGRTESEAAIFTRVRQQRANDIVHHPDPKEVGPRRRTDG